MPQLHTPRPGGRQAPPLWRSPPTTQLVYAREPFNSPDRADIIFRTKDGIHFLVHKVIMMVWSPYWKERLLALEQAGAEPWRSRLEHDTADKPIIPVEEDSATLYALLRHMYPCNAPTPKIRVEDIVALLAAARKYQLIDVVKSLKRDIADLAGSHPLRVYAVAVEHKLPHEMCIAARAALGHPMQERYPQELEHIEVGAYLRLLAYHRTCAKEVVARTVDLQWMSDLADRRGWKFRVDQCQVEGCGGKWLWTHAYEVRKALELRPAPETLQDPEMLSGTLIGATICRDCRPAAYKDLQTFNAFLAEDINRVLELIELETQVI